MSAQHLQIVQAEIATRLEPQDAGRPAGESVTMQPVQIPQSATPSLGLIPLRFVVCAERQTGGLTIRECSQMITVA
jgi:hypothetical protein